MSRPARYPAGRVGTSIRLTPGLHERLRRAACERCVGVNLVVERAIAEYLDKLDQQSGDLP